MACFAERRLAPRGLTLLADYDNVDDDSDHSEDVTPTAEGWRPVVKKTGKRTELLPMADFERPFNQWSVDERVAVSERDLRRCGGDVALLRRCAARKGDCESVEPFPTPIGASTFGFSKGKQFASPKGLRQNLTFRLQSLSQAQEQGAAGKTGEAKAERRRDRRLLRVPGLPPLPSSSRRREQEPHSNRSSKSFGSYSTSATSSSRSSSSSHRAPSTRSSSSSCRSGDGSEGRVSLPDLMCLRKGRSGSRSSPAL